MAKTIKDYTDEYYNSAKIGVDKQYEQRKKTDQQTISDIDATLTKSAQAAEDKYRQQIDAAPGTYHAQFAKNELNEALGRQRAELKMANMGMTDSGLSETSQAALSVQRANANANARRDMQSLVSGLETAISDVWAKKESTLADKTMSINKNTDDWYTSTLAQLSSDAQTAGATAYAAEQEVEAARIKAQQEANDAAAARNKQIADNVFNAVIENGGTVADAMAASYNATGIRYVPTVSTNYYNDKIAEDVGGFGYMGADNNGMAYQPRGVRVDGKDYELRKTGKIVKDIKGAGAKNSSGVNVENQNVWRVGNTDDYVIWNGTLNRYEEFEYNG